MSTSKRKIREGEEGEESDEEAEEEEDVPIVHCYNKRIHRDDVSNDSQSLSPLHLFKSYLRKATKRLSNRDLKSCEFNLFRGLSVANRSIRDPRDIPIEEIDNMEAMVTELYTLQEGITISQYEKINILLESMTSKLEKQERLYGRLHFYMAKNLLLLKKSIYKPTLQQDLECDENISYHIKESMEARYLDSFWLKVSLLYSRKSYQKAIEVFYSGVEIIENEARVQKFIKENTEFPKELPFRGIAAFQKEDLYYVIPLNTLEEVVHIVRENDNTSYMIKSTNLYWSTIEDHCKQFKAWQGQSAATTFEIGELYLQGYNIYTDVISSKHIPRDPEKTLTLYLNYINIPHFTRFIKVHPFSTEKEIKAFRHRVTSQKNGLIYTISTMIDTGKVEWDTRLCRFLSPYSKKKRSILILLLLSKHRNESLLVGFKEGFVRAVAITTIRFLMISASCFDYSNYNIDRSEKLSLPNPSFLTVQLGKKKMSFM